MVYDVPVLCEVGRAATLVLGFLPAGTDGVGTGVSESPALALGLDE